MIAPKRDPQSGRATDRIRLTDLPANNDFFRKDFPLAVRWDVDDLAHFSRQGWMAMKCIETALPGVLVVQPDVLRDVRGFFVETYHRANFAGLGITDEFVQDNHSCSLQGTLRGLHYQLRRPQTKICRVIEGEALDVAVDIRLGSPAFGKWVSVVLSAEKQNQLYIPAGFAHGFLAISPSVQFLYKCSDFYQPDDEYGVLWNDPQLAIAWGEPEPLLSEKDRRLPPLVEIPRSLLPVYRSA